MLRKHHPLVIFSFTSLFAVGSAAVALDLSSVEKARQDYFHSLGKPTKAIREELKKPSPDMVMVRINIAEIVSAAPKLMAQFPAGSGPQAGLKTEVTPEIWSNPPKFKQANDAFQTSVEALRLAAKRDNIPALQVAIEATGKTCKSCHTTFRKDNH